MSQKLQYKISILLFGAICAFQLTGCAAMRSFFALDTATTKTPPIQNPFEDYQTNQGHENIILRTKKGDRSVELEVPGSATQMGEFILPVAPAFREPGSSSNHQSIDNKYKDKAPSFTDREITQNFPSNLPEDSAARREIENSLGVNSIEDEVPARDTSYLAAIDHVKQLFRMARYEAALLELDELIRAYPTDPKLYAMRGTLLDRVGKPDLALKNWNQALRFDPNNESLKRFVSRKQQQRKVAGQ